MESSAEVTQLLIAWSDGNASALERVAPMGQAELQRIAGHYLRAEQPGYLLQTTALVNEAWLRLINWRRVNWQNRAHFFSVAAQLMRRVLVDEARERQAQKRGGDALRVSLSAAVGVADEQGAELLALDRALDELAFSQDGRRLFAFGSDLVTRTFDTFANRKVFSLTGHYLEKPTVYPITLFHGMEISGDGKKIATTADEIIRIWDTSTTGVTTITLKGHRVAVREISFSPDGNRLRTGSSDRTIKL